MNNKDNDMIGELPLEKSNSESEERYVEKDSLHLTEKCLAKIMYKPMFTLFLGLFFSVCFIAMMHVYTIILGIFIAAITIFVAFVVKDYPAMDIYSTFVLIYKLDSTELVRKVDYTDIEEWSCSDNAESSSCVKIKLTNGEMIYKDTFQISKAYRQFNKVMRDKESRIVAHHKLEEKNKNIKFRFKLPFKWPFGNKK